MAELKVIYKNINDIIPYENNPRINDNAVETIADSIKQFGFRNPVIIDKHNVIIAGHTRLKAAAKLGLKEIPTLSADDLTDEQIKAFRLVDNKTAEIAEWDYEKLELELSELETADIDFDITDFGFSGVGGGKQELDFKDDDFLTNESLSNKANKTAVCPYCGKEFEL